MNEETRYEYLKDIGQDLAHSWPNGLANAEILNHGWEIIDEGCSNIPMRISEHTKMVAVGGGILEQCASPGMPRNFAICQDSLGSSREHPGRLSNVT